MEEEEEDTNTDLNIINIISISSQVVTMESVSVDSELRVCPEWRLSPECQQSQPPLYNFVNIGSGWVHAPATGPLHPHFIVHTLVFVQAK